MDATARWTWVGAAVVTTIAAGVFWWSLPDSEPVRRVTPRDPAAVEPGPPARAPAAAKAAKVRPAAAAPRAVRAAAAPRAKVARPEATPANERGAVPEDVAGMIEEIRAERVADSEAKLRAYAERAGWTSETTGAVAALVSTAHARVDGLVAEASAGERPWAEVRDEVRVIRVEQAREVREVLGDEDFAAFARAMGRAKGRKGRR